MCEQLLRSRTRPISLLLVALVYLASCTGWHALPTPASAPSPETPQSLQLTLHTGYVLELQRARVVGDSLIGEQGSGKYRQRTAVALLEIRKLEDRGSSGQNTAILIVGLTGLAALVGYIAFGLALKDQCFFACSGF